MLANNLTDLPTSPIMTQWLYEDIALRPMSDIDILIKDQDIPRTQQMLQELGYYQKKGAYQTPLLEAFAVKWNHLPPFYMKNGQSIEVHTNIFGKHAKGNSQKHQLWNTAQTVKARDITFHRLSNECFLLHLCLHLYNHMVKGGLNLYWICDILELIQRTGSHLNWEIFRCLAENLEAQSEAAQVLATLTACHLLPGRLYIRPATHVKPFDLNVLIPSEKAKQVGLRNLNTANMKVIKRFYHEKGFLNLFSWFSGA